MTDEHTPGPWQLSPGGVSALDENGTLVASAQYNPPKDPRGPRSRQEQRANAHLIAAAPELLEACREVLGLLPDFEDGPGGACENILETAIAKAKGDK